MRFEEFSWRLENGEIHLECTLCGALHWVAYAAGQPPLMRAGETSHEECPICHRIHELVS